MKKIWLEKPYLANCTVGQSDMAGFLLNIGLSLWRFGIILYNRTWLASFHRVISTQMKVLKVYMFFTLVLAIIFCVSFFLANLFSHLKVIIFLHDLWQEEVMFLTQPSAKQHPNVVNLLGFCNRRYLEAVVYDLNPLDTVHNLATTGITIVVLFFCYKIGSI